MDFLVGYLIDECGENIDVPDDFSSKRALLRSLMNVRPPMKISDEFIKVQDEFLTAETSHKDLTSPADIKEIKGKIMPITNFIIKKAKASAISMQIPFIAKFLNFSNIKAVL